MSDDFWTEFVCVDCGHNVVSPLVLISDGEHVCAVCRFIRGVPDMPESVKARMRGEEEPSKP